jgi:hypothetical protein
MIAFAVIVDKTKEWLDEHAEHSARKQKFLNKVYAELLVFGCVNLAMFFVTIILPNLTAKWSMLLNFM